MQITKPDIRFILGRVYLDRNFIRDIYLLKYSTLQIASLDE